MSNFRIGKVIKKLGKENVIYQCVARRLRSGGSSFYNDGTYRVDIYELKINGKKYHLEVQVTGRQGYALWDENKKTISYWSDSQRNLIEYIERELL